MSLQTLPQYETYKDSGIEWLGKIPTHWSIKPLKYLVKINNGIDHKHVLSHDGYPVYGSGGIFAYAKDYLYEGKAILLGRKGTIDKPLFVEGKFWTVDTMFYAVCKKDINEKYVFYIATTIPFKLYSTATALPSMTQADLNSHPVAFPSYSEQTAIAHFLDQKTAQIDAAIAIKEKQIALLKERKQILIQQAVTQGLDPTVSMKDSGVEWIGKIPSEWQLNPLKRVLSLVSEKTLSSISNLSYVGMENIESWSGRFIPSHAEIEGLANRFQKGDILFGKLRPYLAKVSLATDEGICSTEFLVYRTKTQSSHYFRYLLGSKQFINLVDASTYGSKMPRASAEFIGVQKLPIPSIEEQIAIAHFLDQKTTQIDTAIAIKEKQIEKLREYKTTLINSAVTGKIRVTPEMAAV